MKKRKSLMIPAILLFGLLFISGCGDGVPDGTLSTTGATVALTSDMPSGGLSAGQSCILTATLMDKAVTCDDKGVCTAAPQPLSGQVIAFNFIVNESGAVLTRLERRQDGCSRQGLRRLHGGEPEARCEHPGRRAGKHQGLFRGRHHHPKGRRRQHGLQHYRQYPHSRYASTDRYVLVDGNGEKQCQRAGQRNSGDLYA